MVSITMPQRGELPDTVPLTVREIENREACVEIRMCFRYGKNLAHREKKYCLHNDGRLQVD